MKNKRKALAKELGEEFSFLIEEYALEADNNLTKDAIKLKQDVMLFCKKHFNLTLVYYRNKHNITFESEAQDGIHAKET